MSAGGIRSRSSDSGIFFFNLHPPRPASDTPVGRVPRVELLLALIRVGRAPFVVRLVNRELDRYL